MTHELGKKEKKVKCLLSECHLGEGNKECVPPDCFTHTSAFISLKKLIVWAVNFYYVFEVR